MNRFDKIEQMYPCMHDALKIIEGKRSSRTKCFMGNVLNQSPLVHKDGKISKHLGEVWFRCGVLDYI